MAKQRSGIVAENFDGFVLLSSSASEFAEKDLREFIKHIRDHAALGINVVFVDVATAKRFDHDFFAKELAVIKKAHKFDLVFVSSPFMARELRGTQLAQIVQLYEQRDEGVRKLRTRRVIANNFDAIETSISKVMDSVILAGVQRWIGEGPTQVGMAPADVNPASDVVSLVKMNIDGGEFRFYLSSAHSTMRTMASAILKAEVDEADPAISDGACELLNYLTSYFRQKLSDEESVVEATAPVVLPPDEIMNLLNHSPQVRRVQTRYGHFDIWVEVAA